MNRILVICLLFAVATGLTAATAAVVAGWGWLTAFGIYSAFGSVSLVSAAFIAQVQAPKAAPVRRAAVLRPKDERAYA